MQGLQAPVSLITIKELPLILLLIDRAMLSILYDYYYYSSRQPCAVYLLLVDGGDGGGLVFDSPLGLSRSADVCSALLTSFSLRPRPNN